ncbi:replication initiation protein RepC [Bartonella grahamii]|uniref:replication initiation protein RepC n=1 Tax=Bartonella grahamii TaxID=33045 RepID=UPI001ABB6728|nr:replication initiation protein RepC [Bartonella grahamii]
MVNKTSGRKLTSKHWEYIKIADNTDIGHITRSQLLFLVQDLPVTDLIKGTEAHLLAKLLNTVPVTHFEKGKIPIVFKTNHQIGLEIGCTSVHVSRLLSRLFDKGLIVMRDSANYKRYGFSSAHHVPIACGIDLSILIARYHELQHSILKSKEEKKHHDMAVRTFCGVCRRLRLRIAEIKFTPIASMFLNRMNKVKSVLGSPFKASTFKLEKAIKLFNWLLERLFFTKMLCTNNKNVMQLHNTTPNYNCNCNKNECSDNSEHTQTINVTSGHDKMAYENIEKGKSEISLPSKGSTLPQIKPEILEKALPNAVLFSECSFQTESDLIHSMYPMYRMIKVSEQAAEQATKIMGLKKTALAIAIIFEKYARGLVKSPGGYLRGMIDKETRGELYLERSLYALLKQADQEEIDSLNLEKNQKIKLNEEKSSLFEFELNKTLNDLTMSKFT